MINSLIANAVLSIQIGIEDYRSDQFGRSLSAIRNVYAGVLLLCKEVLDRKCPPGSESVLIKSKIVPMMQKDGTVKLVGKGRSTVDRQQIEERFKSLGLSLDWQRLNRLSQIRNEIEHYFSEKPEKLIKEAAADAFVLIHKLVVHHLEEMPLALLVSIREHIESLESFVIPWWRCDSEGAARCGRTRPGAGMTGASCVIRVI